MCGVWSGCHHAGRECQVGIVRFVSCLIWCWHLGSFAIASCDCITRCSLSGIAMASVGAMVPVAGRGVAPKPAGEFEMLMARVGCARLLVAKAKGKLEEGVVSRVQKDALLAAMSKNAEFLPGLSSENRGKLLALLLQCSFAEDDKAAILKMVDPVVAQKKKKSKRKQMQVFYPTILQYFRTDEWRSMRDTADMCNVVDVFVSRLLELGGCNLSEPCMASVVSCMMWLCGAMRLDQQSKSRVLMYVKAEYKRRGRHQQQFAMPYMLRLPAVQLLQAQQPDLWEKVFGAEEPGPAPISSSTILPLVRCRMTKKLKKELADHMLSSGGQSALPSDIVKLMQSMQQSHADLLNLTFAADRATASKLPPGAASIGSTSASAELREGSIGGTRASTRALDRRSAPHLGWAHAPEQRGWCSGCPTARVEMLRRTEYLGCWRGRGWCSGGPSARVEMLRRTEYLECWRGHRSDRRTVGADRQNSSIGRDLVGGDFACLGF